MNNVEKLALEIFKSFITTENKYQFENESYSNRYIDLAVELAQKILKFPIGEAIRNLSTVVEE